MLKTNPTIESLLLLIWSLLHQPQCFPEGFVESMFIRSGLTYCWSFTVSLGFRKSDHLSNPQHNSWTEGNTERMQAPQLEHRPAMPGLLTGDTLNNRAVSPCCEERSLILAGISAHNRWLHAGRMPGQGQLHFTAFVISVINALERMIWDWRTPIWGRSKQKLYTTLSLPQ